MAGLEEAFTLSVRMRGKVAATTYLALSASTYYYTSKTDLTIKAPSGLWWYLKAPGEGNHAWRCLLGGAPEAEGCGRVSDCGQGS